MPAMTEYSVIHKAHTIHLISYKMGEGRWVPEAWVHLSSEERGQGQAIRIDSTPPLPTREAANAVAKKLAIAWVDRQVITAPPSVPLSWTRNKPTRPGWYWYRERGVNLDFPMTAWVFEQPPFVHVALLRCMNEVNIAKRSR
jgi:hypothetical protein